MEGIVEKEYDLTVETNGRKAVTRIREYPEDAMGEFWRAARKLLNGTEGSRYGIDMELAAPSKQTVSLELNEERIIELVVQIH